MVRWIIRSARRIAVVLTVASIVGVSTPGRAQTEMPVAHAVDAEPSIRAALERRTSIEFSDTSLTDVAAAFQRSIGVPIALETKALNDAGVTGDTTFTFNQPNVSARAALDAMLASKELNWVVDRDMLVITTADTAKLRTFVRVYPVADLVFIESAEAYQADFNSLIEAITSIITPQSWDSNGGAGSIAPVVASGAIAVAQTREVHEKIEYLLTRLREVRDQQGLKAALKAVESQPQAEQGGAFDVAEAGPIEAPRPAPRPADVMPRWKISRVYR